MSLTINNVIQITVGSTAKSLSTLISDASATAPSDLKYVTLMGENLEDVTYAYNSTPDSSGPGVFPNGVTSIGRPMTYSDLSNFKMYAASDITLTLELLS